MPGAFVLSYNKPVTLIKPTGYLTPEQEQTVLVLALQGKTLKQIREAVGISEYLFSRHKQLNQNFLRMFSLARAEGYDELAEKTLGYADEYVDVQRARLQSENVRWLLSKVKPETYGDRLDLNVAERPDLNAALIAARARALPGRYLSTQSDNEVFDPPKEVQSLPTGSQPVVALQPGIERRNVDQRDVDELIG